jgi:hypothetical protein
LNFESKVLDEIRFKLQAMKRGLRNFTREEAKKVYEQMNLEGKYDFEQFYMGINVELEHGSRAGDWNVTNDDPFDTAKIALAHLDEINDYYTRLKKMEEEAKK